MRGRLKGTHGQVSDTGHGTADGAHNAAALETVRCPGTGGEHTRRTRVRRDSEELRIGIC